MNKINSFFLTLVTLYVSLVAGAQDNARVSATWQVQKYDLHVTVPQTESDRNILVKARLDLKNVSAAPASTLTLRISPDASVSNVAVNGSQNQFTKGEEKIVTGSLQRIVVRVPTVQSGANLSVAVDYAINLKENGGLASLSPLGAQLLPLSFWYPTPNSWIFPRGADSAPYKLTVNSGERTTVISSGAAATRGYEQKVAGQPFFVSGDFDVTQSSGVSVYLPKGADAEQQKRASEIAALAAEAKTFTTGLLGNTADTPVRIVAVARGGGFNGGGTILLDETVFRRLKLDSLTVTAIAEAVAKIWLGNSVPLSGDGSGVVREGLSKFIATQFLENKFGKEIADVERLRQRAAYASVSTRDAPLTNVSPADDYYYAAVGNKGAMVWRLLAKRVGSEQLFGAVKAGMQDGALSLAEVRAAFSNEKEMLDPLFDQVTDINLLVGLPQPAGAETKVALRNLGSIDATVNVAATMSNGQIMVAPATIRQKSFGEVAFKTANKITRVEVDPEKFYPQTDYSDDIAPREMTESDPLLAVKRLFDKQNYAGAESVGRAVLKSFPQYDDVRVLVGRSLIAQNKNAEAEREFKLILDSRLPSARSVAWAHVGLSEIALKNNQTAQAVKYADLAVQSDAEYGASLAARSIRTRANAPGAIDDAVR
ncbi:MAG: hypothetical protein LC734_07765, partial [Acidobacteria bacterium]|nr:hypothetical protein [Acidobacteriota bacterium]